MWSWDPCRSRAIALSRLLCRAFPQEGRWESFRGVATPKKPGLGTGWGARRACVRLGLGSAVYPTPHLCPPPVSGFPS